MSIMRTALAKSGKYRMKVIRSMARDGYAIERCALRRGHYLTFLKHMGPDSPLTTSAFSRWHDAEYARSIAEGFYDPASALSKYVCRTVAGKGHEITPKELAVIRTEIMSKIAPILASARLPVEYGFATREMREAGRLPRPGGAS